MVYIMFLAAFVAWSSTTEDDEEDGAKGPLVCILLFFVAILMLVEMRQMHCDGIREYGRDKFQVRIRRRFYVSFRFASSNPRSGRSLEC
jgi:hypothetical protein